MAAVTAKKNNPNLKIALIRKQDKAVIPCGIPYIYNRLNSVEENIMPDKSMIDNGVEIIIGKVTKISPEKKNVAIKNGKEIKYEKLILATGSNPKKPPISGIDKAGVWYVDKDFDYLVKMRKAILSSRQIVIIGGGFIGVELAEELSNIKNLKISLVEMLDYCLMMNFDQDFAQAGQQKLVDKGVKVFTKVKVKEIGGDDKVEYVALADGEKIKADAVIIAIGAQPNIELAKTAGLTITKQGAIEVDQFMKTGQPDILAIGDCAQTKDLIAEKDCHIMLASIATTEAQIAADNLYALEPQNKISGVVGAFSTSVHGLALAAVGLTENRAKLAEMDYVIGQAETPNHHPGKLPRTEKITVKLIVEKGFPNCLIGAEIMGPDSVGEMINILSLVVQHKISIFDLKNLQVATHPLLTAAPTVYPIVAAAQDAIKNIENET